MEVWGRMRKGLLPIFKKDAVRAQIPFVCDALQKYVGSMEEFVDGPEFDIKHHLRYFSTNIITRKDIFNAWFTFLSQVLIETFREMWTRWSTHKCRHSHSCDNYAVSSIMRQDIRDNLVSFDLGLIYQHISESYEMRWEQVESVKDETNVPFYTPVLILSRAVSMRMWTRYDVSVESISDNH